MKKSILTKLIMLICIISMLSALCACGKDDNLSTDTDEPEQVVEEVEEDDEEEPEEDDAEIEEEPETEIEEESLEEEISDVTGITSGNTYENSYFGIGITLDDDWNFETQDEIEESREATIQMAGSGDEIQDAFDLTITDMLAINTNGTDTVNIGIEKPNARDYSEDDYIYASVDSICEVLGNMGLENIESDTGTYRIAGDGHGAMKIHGTYNGNDVYELLIVIKKGDYVAIITTCSWFNDITEDIADNVYLLQ